MITTSIRVIYCPHQATQNIAFFNIAAPPGDIGIIDPDERVQVPDD
jgi:hypothetical protein